MPDERTTLYIVRHGETDHNRLGMVQGRAIDSTLNETGRRQAELLGRWLEAVDFDAAYSSSMRRARETATTVIACQRRDLLLRPTADLDEMSWGDFEGRSYRPPVSDAIEEIKARWGSGMFHIPVPGGESVLDVQARATNAVGRILDEHRGRQVLVVTHGRLMRILLASLLPEFGLLRMESIAHDNTGVNVLTFDGMRHAAQLLNGTEHLLNTAIDVGT